MTWSIRRPYFDGVTLTSGFHAKSALYDMERVEILKGPQNTLFGLNTTGGAVNYISVKPEIGAGTEGGHFDWYFLELIPLSVILMETTKKTALPF